MEIRRTKIDTEKEKMISIGCIVSTQYHKGLLPVRDKIKKYFMGSSVWWVLKECFDHFDQYEEAPGLLIQSRYEQALKTGQLAEADAEYTSRLLCGLSDKYEIEIEKYDNCDYLLNDTKKFIKKKDHEALMKEWKRFIDNDNMAGAEELFKKFMSEINEGASDSLQGHTANELYSMDLSETCFHVEGLLTVGADLLAGPPKIGKSWMALQIAIATASGIDFFGKNVQQGGVIYLALEDSFSRIKRRLLYMLNGEPPPDNLYFHIEWPRVGAGGIEALEDFLKKINGVTLIIVDTLEKIRPTRKTGGNPYGEDYNAIGTFKSLVDKHGIAVLIIHHTRKADAADWIEKISGTTGHAGAPDTILLLDRKRGQNEATLRITSREMDDQNLSIEFCPDNGRWKLLGEAEEWDTTPERREIIELLKKADGPMMLKEIAEALGKSVSNVAQLLSKLEKAGVVNKKGYGQYVLNTYKNNKSNKSDTNMNEGFGLNTNKNNKTNKSTYTDATENNGSLKNRVLHRVMERSLKEEFEDG